MFNRNNLPGVPNPFGSRPDAARSSRDNYQYRNVDQQPPPPSGDRMGGYDNHPPPGYGVPQRPPPGRAAGGGPGAARLHPVKSPGGNQYAFGNLIAVSPDDFPPSRDGSPIYLQLNGRYVLCAKPTPGCGRGEIGLTDAQRTWIGVSLGPTEIVEAQIFDTRGLPWLGSVDAEVSFAGRARTDVPYDQDELAQYFTSNFQNQVIAPGQQMLMDLRNVPLRFVIRAVQLVDPSFEKPESGGGQTLSGPDDKGLLTQDTMMNFFKDARTGINLKASNRRPAANAIVQPNFKFEDMGIGGLDNEFNAIFRRAFASRIFPPGIVEKLGIQHVRGILLYGPPGTGKTLIARQIGKMLNAREPKVINGPEVLNKYVGASEENIRKLFADAEKEFKEKGDESGLHIIIFDELDAVCKQRGSGAGGGTGVGDSVVNQLLSKLDGVDQLNNILLIGMTNRMDMIDDALLRPGRLELHMEISLPDEKGRAQILKIHTAKMMKNDAVDNDVDLLELARLTKNYSGAEIAGLVRAASSFAFSRHIEGGTMAAIKKDVGDLKVTMDDFEHALSEVKPLFGAAEEELERWTQGDIIPFSTYINDIFSEGRLYIKQVRQPQSTSLLSVVFHGPPGSGKTALAAKLAKESEFPFIKIVSAEDMVGMGEMQKVQQLHKVFMDAYKSPLSIILIDSIELLVDWAPIGPRFSNNVLIALKVMLEKQPPKGRKLLVLATTTERSVLEQLDILKRFDAEIAVPNVQTQQELAYIMNHSQAFTDQDLRRAIQEIQETTGSSDISVGVKKILVGIETAKQDPEDMAGRFAMVMSKAIAQRGYA